MVDLTPGDAEVRDELIPDPGLVRSVPLPSDAFQSPTEPVRQRFMAKPDFMPPLVVDDQRRADDRTRHTFTRAQILAHAVRLAHLNGWRFMPNQYRISAASHSDQDGYVLVIDWDAGDDPEAAAHPERWSSKQIAAEQILFDKSFAQSLWGQDGHYGVPSWQHHLQQLVSSDDRLLYIGQHLYDDVP
jgi:hypothetical protein